MSVVYDVRAVSRQDAEGQPFRMQGVSPDMVERQEGRRALIHDSPEWEAVIERRVERDFEGVETIDFLNDRGGVDRRMVVDPSGRVDDQRFRNATHDDPGQPTQRTISEGSDKAGITRITHHEEWQYDEQGRMRSHTLDDSTDPDTRRIVNERATANGQVERDETIVSSGRYFTRHEDPDGSVRHSDFRRGDHGTERLDYWRDAAGNERREYHLHDHTGRDTTTVTRWTPDGHGDLLYRQRDPEGHIFTRREQFHDLPQSTHDPKDEPHQWTPEHGHDTHHKPESEHAGDDDHPVAAKQRDDSFGVHGRDDHDTRDDDHQVIAKQRDDSFGAHGRGDHDKRDDDHQVTAKQRDDSFGVHGRDDHETRDDDHHTASSSTRHDHRDDHRTVSSSTRHDHRDDHDDA